MTESAEHWGAVYTRMRPTLIRGLAATVGSYEGVDDAVQDAFLCALEAEPQKIKSIEGWLYIVALNCLRRRLRRNGVFRALRLSAQAHRDPLDDSLARLDLTRSLRSLSRRDRELLIGKYYIGLSQEDLARLSGMKRGTIAAAISRAAARLREASNA